MDVAATDLPRYEINLLSWQSRIGWAALGTMRNLPLACLTHLVTCPSGAGEIFERSQRWHRTQSRLLFKLSLAASAPEHSASNEAALRTIFCLKQARVTQSRTEEHGLNPTADVNSRVAAAPITQASKNLLSVKFRFSSELCCSPNNPAVCLNEYKLHLARKGGCICF